MNGSNGGGKYNLVLETKQSSDIFFFLFYKIVCTMTEKSSNLLMTNSSHHPSSNSNNNDVDALTSNSAIEGMCALQLSIYLLIIQ